ncbi:MAG: DUF1016 family protein [Neisseriaceae bacterium]|nr:DUF1016 family protein [Neisseriaceae bacterium]
MSNNELQITGKSLFNETEYNSILNTALNIIETARLNVARSVNTTVTAAYWEIGKILHERKIETTHGSSVVKRLAEDLKQRYPTMGMSPRQLWDMKKFYERFHNADLKLRQAVAVLPWGHILKLTNKTLDDNAVLFYANESIAKSWSRDLLLNAIKMQMHLSINTNNNNNFNNTLPEIQSSYANEVFKSNYNLGFLSVSEPIKELELERRIVEKIKQFLLEMGKGFTYIGNQYTLEYNGKESRVDLLLYHRKLRCLVAIDLKIGEFKPEYAGKMNYYLSILDRVEKDEDENNSIGIILCAEKNKVQVELALDGINKPIGVADYQLIVPKKELTAIIQQEMKIEEK